MAKTGGRVLKIIGTAQSGPADGKLGGEPIILVGDTSNIKGTKGDTGAAGPAWSPTVVTPSAAEAPEAASATGSIEIEPGVFILTYDAPA